MDRKMIKKCFVLNGRVINIGDWDFLSDADGQIQNPIPIGAVEMEMEFVDTEHGPIPACEYRKLRAMAYPAIGDQLDALFKAGVFPPEMARQIQAVKERYAKP